MAKIAMFLVRSPGPPMTGRKAVINTAIAALAEEGHRIDLFVLAKRDCAPTHRGEVVWLGAVPRASMACNAAWSMLGAGGSLNEALFRSRRFLKRARGLRGTYDFAIADTIRAAPYASALGVPWHLDLDDLFSARYEKYLEHADALSAQLVLGYYRERVPLAGALPKAVLKYLLKREAVRLRSREVYWAGKATTVSLVSPDEAEAFAQRASRPVHSLAMGVRVPATRWAPVAATHGVFLGGLDYKPNLDALLYYQEAIFPALQAMPGGTPALRHLGHAPAEARQMFLPGVVHFEGYVSEVGPRLGEAAFFLAPIVNGTGIKTKVLEAMASGLPVIGTRHAVAGLKVRHQKECFICERPADFAEGVRHVRDPERAAEMGRAARVYVAANFSPGVLRQRWSHVIDELARHAGAARIGAPLPCSTR